MTKSKLEQAVRKHAAALGEAQRELVLSQFSVYQENKKRIAEIDDALVMMSRRAVSTVEEARFRQSQRSTLAYERNQLVTANSRIAAELFGFLKEDR